MKKKATVAFLYDAKRVMILYLINCPQQHTPRDKEKNVKEATKTPNPQAKKCKLISNKNVIVLISDRFQPSKKMCIVTIGHIGDTSLLINRLIR